MQIALKTKFNCGKAYCFHWFKFYYKIVIKYMWKSLKVFWWKRTCQSAGLCLLFKILTPCTHSNRIHRAIVELSYCVISLVLLLVASTVCNRCVLFGLFYLIYANLSPSLSADYALIVMEWWCVSIKSQFPAFSKWMQNPDFKSFMVWIDPIASID